MKIKAVLLDFGGTLAEGALDWEPYHESIRSFLASYGYNIPMKDLKKALRGALGKLEKMTSGDVKSVLKAPVNQDLNDKLNEVLGYCPGNVPDFDEKDLEILKEKVEEYGL